MIAAREFSGLAEFLQRKADARGNPLSGTFELTPICNMNCRMCYIHQSLQEIHQSDRKLRSVSEWLSLATEIREAGTLFLLLTGGEPFMYEGFRELFGELQQMGFILSVNTNGTMIDEKTADWLAGHSPQRINITLYGASNETYARLCRSPDGFSRAKRAIEMLQERGVNVKLNCSVTPENACDLEKIVEYSNERKLILQATSYMFPPLRRDGNSVGKNERFDPEECARMEARIRFLQRGKEALEKYCNSIERVDPIDDDTLFDCEGDPLRCRAGKSSYWITWDGRMLLCGMMDKPYREPFKYGFSNAWDMLKKDGSMIRLPSECAACDAKDVCRSCAAMVYTETGTYSKRPQYRCELLKAIPKACHQLLEEEPS